MRRATWLFVFLLATAGCDDPGEGPKAESGYRFCTPIIAGLEDFRRAHAVYPDSLEQLQIDSVRRRLMPRYVEDIGYLVDSAKAGYELSFYYSGPGRNVCTYTSGAKAWQCHGYY